MSDLTRFKGEAGNNQQPNPFKGEGGHWRTTSLFHGAPYATDPLFHIEDLKQLYLQMEDLTEYAFATKYLGGWEHWKALLKSYWFMEHLNKWRTELELKLKAEALQALIDESRIGGKNSYDAKKYLISKGWVAKEAEGSRRGRPSKAEIAKRAAEEIFGKDIEYDALKRLANEPIQ